MRPDELTVEFAKECYKKADMTPDWGFFGSPSMCGCLVGAMAYSSGELDPDDEFASRSTFVSKHYRIDSANVIEMEHGFDHGMCDDYEREDDNDCPWYHQAFAIGQYFRNNGYGSD